MFQFCSAILAVDSEESISYLSSYLLAGVQRFAQSKSALIKSAADNTATKAHNGQLLDICLLYTSPSPRDQRGSRMPSSA